MQRGQIEQNVRRIAGAMVSIAFGHGQEPLWDVTVGGTGGTVCETLAATLSDMGVGEDLIERFFEGPVDGVEAAKLWVDQCAAAVRNL